MPGYYRPPEGFKSFGQIERGTKGALKYKTLGQMAVRRHPLVGGAQKDPAHPKMWIMPTGRANEVIAEGGRIRRLRKRGYTVSMNETADKFGFDRNALARRDLKQEEILGAVTITKKTRERLRRKGIGAFPLRSGELMAVRNLRAKRALSGAAPSGSWIDSWGVRRIEGALKPSMYSQRARVRTQQQRRQGVKNPRPPEWAKRVGNKWVFRRSYIEKDAEWNKDYIGVVEAATAADVTPRTIRSWADQHIFPSEGRKKGEERRIPRRAFMARVPQLKRRLERSGALVSRVAYGKPVSGWARARLEERRTMRLSDWRVKADGVMERILLDFSRGHINAPQALEYFNQAAENLEMPKRVRREARKRLVAELLS